MKFRILITAAAVALLAGGLLYETNPPLTSALFAEEKSVSSSELPVTDRGPVSEKNLSAKQAEGPSGREKEAEIETISLWQWFRKGGLFMWPILIAAALGMGLIIERQLFFRKKKVNPREFIVELDSLISSGSVEDIEKLCEKKDMMLSRIILKGLRIRSLGTNHFKEAIAAAGAIETASLEKGLGAISAVGNIVPLLGFLGTVSGMITAFQAIAAADQISARLVAGGIFEALITTQAGLVVAIPMLAFYNFFVHRVDSFVAEVERLASDILEMILKSHDKN